MTTNMNVLALTRPTNHLAGNDAPDWRTRAACTDTHPELFFAPNLEPLAREICSGCFVAVDCVTDALAAEGGVEAASRFGVRGGLNPAQRANLYRRNRRAEPNPLPDCDDPSRNGARQHRKDGDKPCNACAAAERAAIRYIRNKARETGA